MVRRTAVYLRISKDDTGEALGIDRQRDAVKTLARAKGWLIDPDWEVVENDTSASVTRRRPGFERLLVGIESGHVEAVVAYALDRLVRRLDDTARLIDTAERHNVPVVTVAGDLDLSTDQGRGYAGLLGAVAQMEVRNMAGRMKAKSLQKAQTGDMARGGRRPYAFTVDRRSIVPEEAEVLRDVAARLIGGASPSGIVTDLNRRKVTTAYGLPWSLTRLRATLARPSLCGRVVHKGVLMRAEDGTPVRGQWEPILDESTFDRLQVALAARRRSPVNWTSSRRHLLSGITRCGLCGSKMLGFRDGKGRWSYSCSVQRHLLRDKDRVDRYVIEQVKARAEETSFAVTGWTDDEGQQVRREISDLEERKHEAARQFVDGTLPADMLRTIASEFDTRIGALQERLVGHAITEQEVDAVTFDLSDFDLMPLEQQRHAVAVYVKRIVIQPAPHRGAKFDPALVQIEWRDHDRTAWHGSVDPS